MFPSFPSTEPYTKPFKFCSSADDIKYVFIGPVMSHDIFIAYCDGECSDFSSMPDAEKSIIEDYMQTHKLSQYPALNPKSFFVKQMRNGVVFLNEALKEGSEEEKAEYQSFVEYIRQNFRVISSFSEMCLKLTPLTSGLCYDGTVNLVARDAKDQYLIHLTGIEYGFYICQPPGVVPEEFERVFIQKIPGCSYEKEYKQDGEFFCFDQKRLFYHMKTTYKTLQALFEQTQDLEYDYNMYFTQDLPPQKGIESVCDMFYTYAQIYKHIDPAQLHGTERLAYEHCKFPFRNYQKNITSIQTRYNLNFQDTLLFHRYKDLPALPGDKGQFHRIEVDIKDVSQAPVSELNQVLKYYKKVMYDIENVVEASEKATYKLWNNFLQTLPLKDERYRQMAGVLQNTKLSDIKPQTYEGTLGLSDVSVPGTDTRIEVHEQNLVNGLDSRCCDQNEIVCISFIVSNFEGTILHRIALVRSEYSPEEGVADEVIVAGSEKELLQETIKILGNKDYNMIQQFNGWAFDNKVIATRCLLHGLFEDFICALDYDGRFSWYNFDFNARIKINGQQDMYGLFQIKNPLRFCFDVFVMNKKMNSAAEKLESNSLNGLLAYYGLGSKFEGVSYQEITDVFKRYKELKG